MDDEYSDTVMKDYLLKIKNQSCFDLVKNEQDAIDMIIHCPDKYKDCNGKNHSRRREALG